MHVGQGSILSGGVHGVLLFFLPLGWGSEHRKGLLERAGFHSKVCAPHPGITYIRDDRRLEYEGYDGMGKGDMAEDEFDSMIQYYYT